MNDMKKYFIIGLCLIASSIMAADQSGVMLKLTGKSSSTLASYSIMITETPDASDNFDSGKDAPLLNLSPANSNSVFFFALVENGAYKCTSIYDDLVQNMELGFQTNRVDDEYTISFPATIGRPMQLYDKVADSIMTISTSISYTFKVTPENCSGFSVGQNKLITDRFVIEPLLTYERQVANGNYGTICFPYKFEATEGVANLYKMVAKNTDVSKVAFDMVALADAQPGVPYVFQANADQQVFKYKPINKVAEVNNSESNGLIGTFEAEGYNTEAEAWVIKGNQIKPAAASSFVAQYRCYIDLNETPTNDAAFSANVPGRKVFGVQNTATGFESLQEDAACCKMMINGQLMIMKNGKMFNAQGQQFQNQFSRVMKKKIYTAPMMENVQIDPLMVDDVISVATVSTAQVEVAD